MRVRINYTISISDETRRAINMFYGKPGLASREEVRNWYRSYGESMDIDLSAMSDDEGYDNV